ncbi:MAG TPA: hypothetical protein VNO17_10230 [Actinomycetota bacterium]|nr:hypothetical protein [Actinomycetota bacterium]
MGRVPEPHRSPKAPEDRGWNWHGTAEADQTDALLEHGGWEAMATAHAWYDPEADPEHDPPREKGAYKLPHHELIDGELRVVWAGVRSAMQVLQGARGGVDLPEGDREAVYEHLAEHYRQFDREPPGPDGSPGK